MTNIIVDTSVATKWYSFKNEDDLEEAQRLRGLIVKAEFSLICPQIIILELANALKFSKKMSQKDCLDSVGSLVDLCANLVEVPKIDLITDLMYKYDLPSYDAVFVALADLMEVPLFTADYKHHKKEISKNIVWLKNWKGKF